MAASDQARQNMRLAMHPIQGIASFVTRHLSRNRRLSSLYSLPENVIDDPQVRDQRHDPLVFRLWSRDPFSSSGVFLVLGFPIGEIADVGRIVQNAGAAIPLATDCCVLPGFAAWARDTI